MKTMYHGGKEEWNEADMSRVNSSDETAKFGKGLYFAMDMERAKQHALGKIGTMRIDDTGFMTWEDAVDPQRFAAHLSETMLEEIQMYDDWEFQHIYDDFVFEYGEEEANQILISEYDINGWWGEDHLGKVACVINSNVIRVVKWEDGWHWK